MIISLIGYRGTGKTTVGMLLADRLGWACIDSDRQIQETVGKSIRQIFDEDGEAAFRDWESRVITELTRRHKLVLALGGGAVLRESNRRAIQVAGPVVWLSADARTIQERLQADPETFRQRPSLTGLSPVDEVSRVLAERLPIYQQAADVTIETDAKSPKEIVDVIIERLELES